MTGGLSRSCPPPQPLRTQGHTPGPHSYLSSHRSAFPNRDCGDFPAVQFTTLSYLNLLQ